MKKFIYLLNILLLLLIPTTVIVSYKTNITNYEANSTTSIKMIKTTVLLDRSNKKKELEEIEKRKKEEEERQRKEEALKKENVIKASAVKSVDVVTPVEVVEQVSSLESNNNNDEEDNNVGDTTTVTVGSSEKAYVGYKFSGNMSAYGRDCCSSDEAKKGLTASGFNIYLNGMYYNDSQYGRMRIIAASRDDFYLYSVIKISDPIDGNYTAIVLDRGDKNIGIGRKFVFDLVVESQEWARINYGVHKNVEFEVLRIGK